MTQIEGCHNATGDSVEVAPAKKGVAGKVVCGCPEHQSTVKQQ